MLGEVIGGVTLGSNDDVGKRVVCSNCYEVFRLTKEMGGMVPMVWDTNYTSQNGTKGFCGHERKGGRKS